MISKQKNTRNAKIPILLLAVFGFLSLSFSSFFISRVEAGGKPDGQGNVVGSLCYVGGSTNRVQLLSTESTRQGCVGFGGQIIEPGQPVPVPFCYLSGNGTAAIRQLAPNETCTDGQTVRAGEPLPTILITDPSTQPGDPTQQGGEIKIDPNATTSGKWCGEPDTETAIDPVVDLGCKGKGNGILDLTFAIVRFLTLGAGLVMIGSTIVAGIQYTASRGEPQATAAALKRITSTVSALLLFIFAYAILNWVVPAGILR